MSHEVFISYARNASAAHAQALAAKLGEMAFLDTEVIDDGDQFPPRLLTGLLGAKVVVVFATKAYSEHRFCRLEMRLALAGGDAAASHVVFALGAGYGAVLDATPELFAGQSWPTTEATSRLDELVRQRLTLHSVPLRSVFPEAEAHRLSAAFLEESNVSEPQLLNGTFSLPLGVANRSIGSRFVGRAKELRRIHEILSEGFGASAPVASRITASGGFGKTRLATEYFYRYGPRYYAGGLFWVNAANSAIEDEFWRILNVLDDTIPNLAVMRDQKRDVRRELERALRRIHGPVLYVIDNIPEAAPGEDARSIQDFCPALGAVTVLATSRQDTHEEGVRTIAIDSLGEDASVLLLTENLRGARRLSWRDWARVANWVGNHPLALDLLNRCLALNSISIEELLNRVISASTARSPVGELDDLRDALRGQVTADSLRGITDVFAISFDKLEVGAQVTATLLAQLAPAPIPKAFFDTLPEYCKSPAIRTALRSRHLVTGDDELSLGVMHKLVGAFLRNLPEELQTEMHGTACSAVAAFMTADRCRDPLHWPMMNLLRPHAQFLLERAALVGNVGIRLLVVGAAAATLAFNQAEYAEHRRLWELMVEIWMRAHGSEHPDTLLAMGHYAEALRSQGDLRRAQSLEEQIIETNAHLLGEDHPDTLHAMSDLAETLCAQHCYGEAQQLQECVLEKRLCQDEDHLDTLSAMRALAETLRAQKRYAEAQQLHERLVERRTRLQGENHPDTLSTVRDLARTLSNEGKFLEAQRLQERVLEVSIRVWGEEHLNTLGAMSDLAALLEAKGDLAQAKRLENQVFELKIRLSGEKHALGSMERLASILSSQGDYMEARRLLERVVDMKTRLFGEDHPETMWSMKHLAETLIMHGEGEASRRPLERVLEGRMSMLGAEHPDTLDTMSLVAAVLLKAGNPQRGLELLRQCLTIRRKVLGYQHPDTTYTAELLLRFEQEQASGGNPEPGESDTEAS